MAKHLKDMVHRPNNINIRQYGVLGGDPTVLKAFTRLDAGGYNNVAFFAKWVGEKLEELDQKGRLDHSEALLRLSYDDFTKSATGDVKRGDFQMALLKSLTMQMLSLDMSGSDSLDKFIEVFKQISDVWGTVENYATSKGDPLLAEDAGTRKRKALEASQDRFMMIENLGDKHLYIMPSNANGQVERLILDLMGTVGDLLKMKIMPNAL